MGRTDHISLDGGESDSEEEFDRSIKTRNSQVYRLDDEESLTVRFLHEPYRVDGKPGWYKYREHWTDEFKKFPCLGAANDCPGCEEGDRGSLRWLAAALDIVTNKVITIMLPQMLVVALQNRYKKHGTIMDRDYELVRSTGANDRTTYTANQESPARRSTSRFHVPDLKLILLRDTSEDFKQLIGFEDGEEDETESKTRAKKKGASTGKKPARRGSVKPARRRVADEDDEDDDEDDEDFDDDEEDDEPPARRRTTTRRPASKKVSGRPVRRR